MYRHMDSDEREVAEATARFLRDGDERIALSSHPRLTMTLHRAGFSRADDRIVVAKVVDARTGDTDEYEVEVFVRRKASTR